MLGDQRVDEEDAAAAIRVLETNFVGLVPVLVPVARRLREQGHGSIVVLSSVAAERPRRANFVYGYGPSRPRYIETVTGVGYRLAKL